MLVGGMIATQKKHILDSNCQEFHIFLVVILPKILDWHVLALVKVTNIFCKLWSDFKMWLLMNWVTREMNILKEDFRLARGSQIFGIKRGSFKEC